MVETADHLPAVGHPGLSRELDQVVSRGLCQPGGEGAGGMQFGVEEINSSLLK